MVFPPELSGVTTHLPNSPYHSQPAAWGCSPVRTWEQSGGPQEAGGRMEDTPGHMGSEARQRVEGTCPGSQGWGSLAGACGLWVQICVIFTLLCPIILNSQCKLLIAQSRPLESKQTVTWYNYISKRILDQEYICFPTLLCSLLSFFSIFWLLCSFRPRFLLLIWWNNFFYLKCNLYFPLWFKMECLSFIG